MDTLKAGTYSDAPDSPAKSALEAQPLHPETCHAHGRQSLVKRHWVALGAAALTWLALSYGMRALSEPHRSWHWAGDRVGLRPPPDGDTNHPECVGGTNWTTYYDNPSWTPNYPYGAETAFNLPIDSDALFLLSRGVFQQGQVNIEQSAEVKHTADVRVRVAYSKDKLLEFASVCQLHREANEHGVGIFTPRWLPHPPSSRHNLKDQLEFDVTITLPAGNEGPLSVKKLETNVPNYSHNVAELQESVLFDKISLTSVNGRLTVQSVTFEDGHFSVVNGEITGQFKALSSLDLRSINGQITPTVNLLHREGGYPSDFSIHTVNGGIDARITLTSKTSTGGEFGVDAKSNHGEVVLAFEETPVDSVLRCQAETTVGKVEVKLDSAFEGGYSLQNVLGAKLVSQHDVEDPSGRNRRRIVTVNEAAGRVEGELEWVESNGSSSGNEGFVVLKSVVAPVQLFV